MSKTVIFELGISVPTTVNRLIHLSVEVKVTSVVRFGGLRLPPPSHTHTQKRSENTTVHTCTRTYMINVSSSVSHTHCPKLSNHVDACVRIPGLGQTKAVSVSHVPTPAEPTLVPHRRLKRFSNITPTPPVGTRCIASTRHGNNQHHHDYIIMVSLGGVYASFGGGVDNLN